MHTWTSALDTRLGKLENRIPVVMIALLIGGIIYAIAMALVSGAGTGPGPHGWQYMALSEAPFDFSIRKDVGFRRMGPILGFITGLRGDRFLWLTSLCAAFIPAALYLWGRQRNMSPSVAVGVALLVGTTGVLLIHFIARGYVDPIYYLLAMSAFLWRKKTILSAVLLLMAIMTHECIWALAPAWWLYGIVLQKGGSRSWLIQSASFLAVIAIWAGWRLWLGTKVEASFDFEFYFTWENVRMMLRGHLAFVPLGAFYALKLGWAVPLRAMSRNMKQAEYGMILVMLLLIGGVTAQALVALDLGRLFALAFPVIPIGLLVLHQQEDLRSKLSVWIWQLNLANLPLLFYYVASKEVHPLLPYPLKALIEML
ncbi:MAG: hypothetical protein AB8F95_15380 [Bacteroidia bacterium]